MFKLWIWHDSYLTWNSCFHSKFFFCSEMKKNILLKRTWQQTENKENTRGKKRKKGKEKVYWRKRKIVSCTMFFFDSISSHLAVPVCYGGKREKKLSKHEWNAFDVKAYSSYQSQSHHCVKWISLKKVKVEFPFNATQESTNNNISLRFERSNCQSINKQTIALLRLIQCKQLALFITFGGFVT